MSAYTAPVDEIFFALDHVAGAARLPGWDADLARDVVRHFAEFAETEIAPLDEPGDVAGCVLENGRVRMPEGFGAVYDTYAQMGWPALTAPEAHGGQGMPAPVHGAVTEIFSGACHALQMVVSLVACAVDTLVTSGTADQQARLIPPLLSGEWLATMALTEPGAGSDLAAVRTRAEPDGNGGWTLTGEKIFISGGDQDMSAGILHLVLARTGPAESGTRGLSLFACPSHLPDKARNHVQVARIEEKMGLHASPTCHMVFDAAHAELVGEEGGGLRAMFTMMNHARLDVCLQGVAHAQRAYDIARSYAAERVQGSRPGTGRVTIDQHPDVRRMLNEQEALATGARAMCHIALVELALDKRSALLDFLTPVCKVFASEAGMRSADLGIQVLGGYGYLREYRVEQTVRDSRITAIYEGANGIHAVTLAGRLLTVRDGACADAFETFIAGALSSGDAVAHELALWRRARQLVEGADDPADHAADFMTLTAELTYLATWAMIEAKANHAPDPDRTRHLARLVRQRHRPRLTAAALHLGILSVTETLT